jgi:valyl-tRNA synthetase
VGELEQEGLLLRQEPHSHAVGHCQRSGTVLEPLVTDQWYVKIKPLAEPAIEAVRDGRITIVPERFAKVYFNWMENIRDWAISRQLWWGHRIPVWYCAGCGGEFAAVADPEACAKCGSAAIRQDEDVLDTWFSSGLWPFSTLGWPEQTDDLRTYYPSSVMETGYDILFFWVARMIMLGLEMTGEVPFRWVYLHGLIRVERQKMSKTLGNVQDPLQLIEQYGTDALRLALVTGTTPGNDINLSKDHAELEASRNFVNKLWNAARFVRTQLGEGGRPAAAPASLADRWIVSRAQAVVAEVDQLLEDFQLGQAAGVVSQFIWDDYCDWYIEIAKVQLRDAADEAARAATLATLADVLDTALRLLHPFAPFVTEVVWQTIRREQDAESIMIADWPRAAERDQQAEAQFEDLRELVVGIRRLRADYGVQARRWVAGAVEADGRADLLRDQSWVGTLARVEPIEVHGRLQPPPRRALSVVAGGYRAYLPVEGLFDPARELERLGRERQEVAGLVDQKERLLGSAFADRAPADRVQAERDRLAELRQRLDLLDERLDTLRALDDA